MKDRNRRLKRNIQRRFDRGISLLDVFFFFLGALVGTAITLYI